MHHDLEHTIALLTRTPATYAALLRDLPETWTHRNEGEKTWTAFDIVGHLIHAERTGWIPRTRHLLEAGESQPFPSFDRFAQLTENREASLSELLDTFARLRAESIASLRGLNLQPEDLERRGLHPSFGSVTLSHLLATWAAHDLSHLHQLTRVMAHQYREQTGPWSAFLGVMKCEGHSE